MLRDLAQPSHLLILAVIIVVLFGWKKLPDAARSVGRSMRIFKSEMSEMKSDGKEARPSPAATDTVPGTVPPAATSQTPPYAAPPAGAQPAAPQPVVPQPVVPQPMVPQQSPVVQQQHSGADAARHDNPAL
ncbi:Sec-independent protein translocase subunit TatA [Lapillicoccus sp.]|uniref:Sec-independent protein translocase subunit TatA n=1 Tax=Lapillicoccus sp. TaxID=1909287 RepID=UPI003983573E